MNILPIVERELLVRARQGRTQWTRLGVSAVGVFLSLQFLALWGGASVNLAQLSGFAFQALAWIGFLLGCAGCLVTADCLSGERREGTLGLLLLTRVGVGEVVLGKLASNGLAAVFGLVALTPTLMLPVLAGGVTWRQVMWTAGSWLAMLWFSLCLGLWASGGGWAKAKSLKRAAAGFGLFVFLPWLLGSLQLRAGVSERGRAILCLSPATAFLEAAVSGTTSSGLVVIGSCAASVGLGMGFLYQARRELKRSAGDSGLEGTLEKDPTAPRDAVQPLGDRPPLEWLLARDRSQSRVLWLAALLGAMMPALNFLLPAFGSISQMGLLYSAYFLGGVGSAALFAVAGMRFLGAGRGNGSLELLCTTPVGATGLIPSIWHVLRRRLTGPLLVLVAISLIGNLRWMTQSMGASGLWGLGSPVQIVLTAASIVVDAVALGWLGMWFGLRARTPLSAVLWSVGLVWGLDLILSYALQFLVMLSPLGFNRGLASAWGLLHMLGLPLICIGKQIWLVRWASRQLRDSLSLHGVEPFDVRCSWKSATAWVRRARHWTGGGV